MIKIEAVKNLGDERLRLTYVENEAALTEFLGHLMDSGDWAGDIEQTAQRRVRIIPLKHGALIATDIR